MAPMIDPTATVQTHTSLETAPTSRLIPCWKDWALTVGENLSIVRLGGKVNGMFI